MTKLNIMNNKRFMIKYIDDINERICIMISSNMSNHALNVNINLEYDKKKSLHST